MYGIVKEIRKGPTNLTLYVVRVAASGLRQSGPCKQCLSAIRQVGIKKIVFSDDDGMFEMHTSNSYTTEHLSSGFRHMNDL